MHESASIQSRPVRVLVSAGAAVRRAGLAALLTGGGAAEVVETSGDLRRLVQTMERLAPDAVVADIEGAEAWPGALAEWARLPHPPRLVLLADELDPAWLAQALRAGVHAILPRDCNGRQLLAATTAPSDLVLLDHAAAGALLERLPADLEPDHALEEPLTTRELEVLTMLSEGLTNKEIAHGLGISEHTVKFHLGSIFGKLDVGSRTEAVRQAWRHGLLLL